MVGTNFGYPMTLFCSSSAANWSWSPRSLSWQCETSFQFRPIAETHWKKNENCRKFPEKIPLITYRLPSPLGIEVHLASSILDLSGLVGDAIQGTWLDSIEAALGWPVLTDKEPASDMLKIFPLASMISWEIVAYLWLPKWNENNINVVSESLVVG